MFFVVDHKHVQKRAQWWHGKTVRRIIFTDRESDAGGGFGFGRLERTMDRGANLRSISDGDVYHSGFIMYFLSHI